MAGCIRTLRYLQSVSASGRVGRLPCRNAPDSALWSSTASCSRSFATASDKPDYYGILGIRPDATQDQVKKAFREQAKQHHPDLKKGATDADVHVFKLINEAYTVLGDNASRREYDHERRQGRPTGVSLRVRNEGVYGGTGPVERPTSVYDAPADWQGTRSSVPAAGKSEDGSDGSNGGEQEGGGQWDQESAFRASMQRANDRQKDGARVRAAMARMNRPRVEVPDQGTSLLKMAVPLAVLGIWGVNYWFFMRG